LNVNAQKIGYHRLFLRVSFVDMLEKSVKNERLKIVYDLISRILMKEILHHIFSNCTNTVWVRDPWLGSVGVVEVKAFVAPPISIPCSSITVQAP